MRALCDECNTFIITQDLIFNTKRMYVEPIKISNEVLSLKDKDILYILYSDYLKNKSILNVTKDVDSVLKNKDINLPLITMASVKNRDRLLNKIKKIILFS